MNKFLCILFLLPTIVSFQNAKTLNDYDIILKDICLDNLSKCHGSKNFHSEKYYQSKNSVQNFYNESKVNNKLLKNFEKQTKEFDFAENIYYKGKIYKVKNKDYLDLKTLALQTYDQGKTIKDAYTHHFNKVYRKQIAEL